MSQDSFLPLIQKGMALLNEQREVDLPSTFAELKAIFTKLSTLYEQSPDKMHDEKQNRLQNALDLTGIGIWELDIASGIFTFSDQWIKLLGYNHDELDQRGENWSAHLHPDDKTNTLNEIIRFQNGESNEKIITARLKCKDGSYRWFLIHGKVRARNTSGKPQQVIGTMNDITSQKDIENDLIKSKDMYYMIFNEMLDGFALHDIICDEQGKAIDYRYIDVNPAFEKLTGLKRELLIGRTVREALPGIESYWIEKYGNVALTGEPINFENFAKDLDRYYHTTAFCPQIGQFAVIFQDVTFQRRAEEKIKESEKRYRSYVDNAPDGIFVINENGKFYEVNPAGLKMTGYSAEELLNLSISDIIHSQDQSLVQTHLVTVVTTGSASHELAFVDKSGTKRYWNIDTVKLTETRLLVFAKDVTDKHHAAEALSNSEMRLSMHVQQTPLGVIEADVNLRITSWNPAAIAVFGHSEKEALNQDISQLIFSSDQQTGFQTLWDLFVKGNGNQKEVFKNVRKNGHEITCEWYLTPLYDKTSQLTSIACLVLDISEKIEAEIELKRAIENLTRSNKELENFAYVASHDLQEPLRKIQAFSDRLMSKYLDVIDDHGKEYITRMHQSAERMQVLINDLLAFSRLTTQVRSFETIDLNMVFKNVLNDLEINIEKTGAKIETGRLPVIEGDEIQMSQLFLNLLSNSLKFRFPDRPPVIKINAVENRKFYQITVTDNGIGFDEKYLERIFVIFQRLHNRSEFEGTGIGLAMCKKIVERHNGSITASSKPDMGATFIIELPKKLK